MNDRKQTPDILAEILSGDAPAVDLPLTPPPAPRPRKAAVPHPKSPAARPPAGETKAPKPAPSATPAAPQNWRYQVVSLQEFHGWRPRFIDGQSVKDWERGMLLHELLAAMGEQGWELVSTCSGEALFGRLDKYQLYFKRPA
jgi:hypothetical protein